MMAVEAVLTSDDGANVVATITFGYETHYALGLRTPIPDRMMLDERIFELVETVDDENGRVAYYGELVDNERIEAT